MNVAPPQSIAVFATATASLAATASASVRANLSISHLLSAAHFAREVGRVEQSHAGEPLGDFWDVLQSNATATVMTSVAGIEAYINELFVDYRQNFPDIEPHVLEKLWELLEQKPPLEKFDLALSLLRKPSVDRDASPSQDVVALVKLRNGLTHYKPEWSDQQVEHAKISRQLKHRAVCSPFFPAHEPLFPRSWASYGTAKWSVNACVTFIEEFEQAAGTAKRMNAFKDKLSAA